MWKRAFPWLLACGLAAALAVAARYTPASEDPPAKAPGKEPAPGVKSAVNRIAAVTVYPNSALVAREVDVPEGAGTMELVVTPLPPATIHNSLYTEGADGVRILSTRFRSRPVFTDVSDEVRKLQDELEQLQTAKEKLEADVKANQANTQTLGKMESFMGVTVIQATEKGALNSEAAIALSKHIMDSRSEKSRELVGLQQQLQANQKKVDAAQRRLGELASAPTRIERDAVLVVEKTAPAAAKVRLHYLVDSASWRPQYKLRAGKAVKDPVQLEYLAAVSQHTGEDWSGVEVVLANTQPSLNSASPDLQTLQVVVVPKGAPPAARAADAPDLEEQVRSLRGKAQRDFNDKKHSSAVGLVNTAAALDQSWELFNPDAAMKRGPALAAREGPTVVHRLRSKYSVPSRSDEQVLEVARLELEPDYYYKAVPILSSQVYRHADLTNRSNYVLLPGEAAMYSGADFVGQMSLPLVAVGEAFTVGFGADPQLQVTRQMTGRERTTQGANQQLRYEYRLLVNNLKAEKVKVQVWDRLPHAENASAVGVSLLKASPDVSKDAYYQREQRPNNLLRWDVTVEPNATGDKALAITYEFKMELDSQATIGNFQSSGVFGEPGTLVDAAAALADLSPADIARIKAELAKLSPEDRKLAEAQVFCAVDQENALGSNGPIIKTVIKGQPVFLCCKGCLAEAKAHPDETLVSFQKLMARMAKK
jgi:uncharacterized protein (TIGR02231 family)